MGLENHSCSSRESHDVTFFAGCGGAFVQCLHSDFCEFQASEGHILKPRKKWEEKGSGEAGKRQEEGKEGRAEGL